MSRRGLGMGAMMALAAIGVMGAEAGGVELLPLRMSGDPLSQRRPEGGARGKVGTSKKVKERRKRERQNRKRGRS